MRCLIAYFSGTGTTEAVVRMLGGELERLGYEVVLARMEDSTLRGTPIDPSGYDLFGLASPVLEYGTPRIVMDFVRLLPVAAAQRTFILRTAGGVAPQNYHASKSLIRRLSRKGYSVFYERILSLGSNWIVKFSDATVHRLHEAALRKTALMARDLREGRERFLKAGPGTAALMGLVSFLGRRSTWLIGKDLRVSRACTSCGLCARSCPRGNIRERDGRIKFGSACICCMRCVYSCPSKAIRHKLFSFFAVPGGYDLGKILEDSAKDAPSEAGAVPPFLAAYAQDDRL
jgi:ferredoxin